MKYLIKESQLNNIIFNYLDNQDFIQIETDDNIYFTNSERDEFAQIGFDKKVGWCYIYNKLVKEVSSFFSIGEYDSKKVIGKWVGDALQMRVVHTTIGEQLAIYFI